MWGNGKSGSGKPVAAITTLIAEGTVIRGDVQFDGGLHLDGIIEGSITAEGSEAVLTLSNKGRVHGKISTSNAVINGQVLGDIVAVQRLELAGDARVEGNVYYRVLEMAAGAQINGKMIYQGEAVRQLAGPEPVPAEA
ncbi:MAG TPA: polymer-forming cytoskeletal protein [Dokdonella sp.]|uniref:bactofilin family protein n=1 Tax=Dokdonella sp. TaxID=2291710 RepID=UPI002C9A5AA6|nr:polymer-forming cytoskeletal protein [Dokdonella sp.]HUD41463.1 polymer-forming cytoskeletal protein [Dokdonella sp.]